MYWLLQQGVIPIPIFDGLYNTLKNRHQSGKNMGKIKASQSVQHGENKEAKPEINDILVNNIIKVKYVYMKFFNTFTIKRKVKIYF